MILTMHFQGVSKDIVKPHSCTSKTYGCNVREFFLLHMRCSEQHAKFDIAPQNMNFLQLSESQFADFLILTEITLCNVISRFLLSWFSLFLYAFAHAKKLMNDPLMHLFVEHVDMQKRDNPFSILILTQIMKNHEPKI